MVSLQRHLEQPLGDGPLRMGKIEYQFKVMQETIQCVRGQRMTGVLYLRHQRHRTPLQWLLGEDHILLLTNIQNSLETLDRLPQLLILGLELLLLIVERSDALSKLLPLNVGMLHPA